MQQPGTRTIINSDIRCSWSWLRLASIKSEAKARDCQIGVSSSATGASLDTSVGIATWVERSYIFKRGALSAPHTKTNSPGVVFPDQNIDGVHNVAHENAGLQASSVIDHGSIDHCYWISRRSPGECWGAIWDPQRSSALAWQRISRTCVPNYLTFYIGYEETIVLV